jgi:hypothetical protein
MASGSKCCMCCGHVNRLESNYCALCGSPFAVPVEHFCLCYYPEPVFVEPDYPEAVFPDPRDYPEAVFATIIT